MSAVSTSLLQRRWLLILIAVAVVSGIGFVAWRALRGGGSSIDGRTVQRLVADDMRAELSELLDLREQEVTAAYEGSQLEEEAEKQDLSRTELITRARSVAVEVLQEAVQDGEITSEQADQALRMVMRAITNHL